MTRIALLSDIHFGKFSRTNDFIVPGENPISNAHGEKSLKEELISRLKAEKVEFIIITGDLTSVGSPSEFNYCRLAIDEIAKKAGVSSKKVIISLGNHDIDWSISSLSSNHNNIQEHIQTEIAENYLSIAGSVANHWLPSMNNYKYKGPAPFTGVIENNDIIFFVLNSGWMCSQDLAQRQGKLADKQCDWLSKILIKYKDSQKWKILILHHHPFNYPYPKPTPDHSVLMEGPELSELIGKNGVNIVCHGHRHHPRVKTELENGWVNPITFISSGSLSVNVEHRTEDIPNLFHVIELDNDKSFYLRSYRFNSMDGWTKLPQNNSHTPLDFEMFFHKPFIESDVQKSLEEICLLSDNDNSKILASWKDLPKELKSIKLDELNRLLGLECSKNNMRKYGNFPNDEVLLLKNKL